MIYYFILLNEFLFICLLRYEFEKTYVRIGEDIRFRRMCRREEEKERERERDKVRELDRAGADLPIRPKIRRAE